MIQRRRRPVDALSRGPAMKGEVHHAKPTDGIKAGLRAIYEPQDYPSERLSTLLREFRQEKRG